MERLVHIHETVNTNSHNLLSLEKTLHFNIFKGVYRIVRFNTNKYKFSWGIIVTILNKRFRSKIGYQKQMIFIIKD